MKVFISQPMNGLTEEEILGAKALAVKYLRKKYGEGIKALDTYFDEKDIPEGAGALWCLGRSIQMMEQADAVYFVPGAEKARGCIIEYGVAELYGLKILK